MPDTAAGTSVRCPKCRAAVRVPAGAAELEVIEDSPADGERPRKRRPAERDRRKPAKSAASGGVLVRAVVAGLVGLGGIGFATYWFGFRPKPDGETVASAPAGVTPEPASPRPAEGKTGGNPTPVTPAAAAIGPPAGWKEFVAAEDNFAAYFPAAPQAAPVRVSEVKRKTQDDKWVTVNLRDYDYASHAEWPDLACRVTVVTTTPSIHRLELPIVAHWWAGPRASFETATRNPDRQVMDLGKATLAGLHGRASLAESPTPTSLRGKLTADGRPIPDKLVASYRYAASADRAYVLRLQTHNSRPKADEAFFASFRLAQPPPPLPATVPDDWTEYTHPEGRFKARMPPGVTAEEVPFPLPARGTGDQRLPMLGKVVRYRSTDAKRQIVCEVYVAGFGPGGNDAIGRVNGMSSVALTHTAIPPGTFRAGPAEDVTWNGSPGREYVFLPYGRGSTRYTYSDTVGIVATVHSTRTDPDPAVIRGFFQGVRFQL